MNKTFYISLIVFLALSAFAGLVHSILRFVVGETLPYLESYIPWFLVSYFILFAGTVLLIRYYHFRKYRFTFYAGIAGFVAILCYAVVIYRILVSGEMMNYYSPMLLLALVTGIIYAISLIIPPAGEKRWLKITGTASLVYYGLLLLFTVMGIFLFPSGPINTALGKISAWISLLGNSIPILLCMHFQNERREMEPIMESGPGRKFIPFIPGMAMMLALVSALVLSVMISSDSYSSVYWAKKNFEKTKQLAQLFEAHAYVSSKNDTLFYRLLKPLKYDSTKTYPLVVSLPYGGRPGTDKIRQIEGAAAAGMLSSDSNRTKYPAFLFIPNLPSGTSWGGLPNHRAVDSLVYETIESLDQQYKIDPKRRYVTGISKGGYGAWHFICTRPDMFAAAIPVCGAGNPELAHRITNVSVWAFHGRRDRNVPVSGSRDMIKAIIEAGGDPRYTEFPNEAHHIWYQVTKTQGVLDWLFAQEKQ